MGAGKYQFEELLKLLPAGWEEKAKELGALRRARNIKTAGERLRLVLLYLTGGKSFTGTSAIFQLGVDAKLNKNAAYKRIRNCADWLQWICGNCCWQTGLLGSG